MHTNRLEYAVTSSQIQIVAGERQLPAFLAYPDSGGRHPGVVLLDGAGHAAALRQVANRLAQRGLYVVAPALEDLPAAEMLAASVAEPAAAATVRAASQVLRTHNHCTGSLVLIGLSPASSALILGAHPAPEQAAAVVTFQAPPALAAEAVRHDGHPLLLIYSGPATPALHRLQRDFTPTSGKLLLRYPRAGAAFFSRPQTDTDRRCAGYAWMHLLAFLEEHLDWPRPARPAKT